MIVHMVKKRGSRKRFLVAPGIILLAAGYATFAVTQPLLNIQPVPSYTFASKSATEVPLAWPEYGQSAIGAPGYGILATRGTQKAIPIASVAKVMTALAVLRQQPLRVGDQGPDIVITQTDVDSYRNFVAGDGSVVGVALGERISEYEALQALLLPSANNMADTLARWAFGSIDAYNTYANAYAKQLGLYTIHIADPSGYDVKTVASAEDLTLLGNLAMLNPVFAEIVAQPTANIPVQGTVRNYNFMLGENGNVGIKTGNNDGNNGAFLFASKQLIDGQEMTIVGTILDAPDLSTALRDSGPLSVDAFKGFSTTTFVTRGQKVGSYDVPGQISVAAVAATDLRFPTWNGMGFNATVNLTPLTNAKVANSNVGNITARNTKTNVTSSSVVKLDAEVKQPSLVWRLTHPLGR